MKTIAHIFVLLICLQSHAQVPDSLALIFKYEKMDKMGYLTDSSANRQGVSVKKIRYSGNDKFVVSAFLTAPERAKGKLPLIVFGHWGEGDKSEFLDEAITYSKKGFVCLLPDGPWLCPDSPIKSFKKQGFEMYLQYVKNARTGIDLTQQHFAIDEKRIAYIGHSFGCNAASVLSAIDKRITHIVFMAGAYSTVSNIENSNYADFVAWRKNDPASFADWKKRIKNLDAQYYLPYKTAPCLIQVADKDEYLSATENDSFISAVPIPKEVLHYDTGHSLIGPPQTDRQQWIFNSFSP